MTTTKLLSLTALAAAAISLAGVNAFAESETIAPLDSAIGTDVLGYFEDADEEASAMLLGEKMLDEDVLASLYATHDVSSGSNGLAGDSMLASFGTEILGRVEITQSTSTTLKGASLSPASVTNSSEAVTVRQSAVAMSPIFEESSEQYAEVGKSYYEQVSTSDYRSAVATYSAVSFLGNFVTTGNSDSYYGTSYLSGGSVLLDGDDETTYTWTGNGSGTDWSTAGNWDLKTSWADNSNAIFPYYGDGSDTTVGSTEVTISTAIVAGTVTIGDTYTFTVENGSSLTMTELAPDTEHDPHLTIAGEGAVTIGESGSEAFVLAGVLTIAGSTVTFNVDVDLQGGTMEVTGGKVIFSQATTTIEGDGKLDISSGDAEFSGAVNIGGGTGSGTGTITIGTNDGGSSGTVEFKGNVNIGTSGNGYLTINGGTNTFGTYNNGVYIGYDSNSTGTLTIKGGTNSFTGAGASGSLYVGYYGTGYLYIEGGDNTFSKTVEVGSNSGSTGYLTIVDGDNTFSSYVYVGFDSGSEGTITISGGTNRFSDDDYVYTIVGERGTGTLTITGGTNTFSTVGTPYGGNYVYVGYYSGSEGTIEIYDGENTFYRAVYVGYDSGSTGYLNIDGGTNKFESLSAVLVGEYGTGYLTITKGDNTFSGQVFVGNNSTGTMTIDGGTNTFSGEVYVGNMGTGTMEISGGKNTFSSSSTLNVGLGGTGTLKITGDGGENTFSGSVYLGNGGNGTMTIEGGKNKFEGNYVYVGNNSAGTMEISGGENTFSKTVYVGYSSAGTMTIEGGETEFSGTLNIGRNTNVGTMTITGGKTTISGTTTLASNGSLTIGGSESTATVYLEKQIGTATNGSVTISDNAKIILGDVFLTGNEVVVIEANSITLGNTPLSGSSSGSDLDTIANTYFFAEGYDLTWSYDGAGTLYVTATEVAPEPELFSILLGISALGLVATRRRRRKN